MITKSQGARRAIAAAAFTAAAALAAACGSTSGNQPASAGSSSAPAGSASAASSSATPGATATATSSASPAAAGAAKCATSALHATVDTSAGGAAAGSVYVPIDFTNASASPCTMYGYPGVSFVTGSPGSQIGSPAARNPGVTPATVTLAPGGTAHATLQVADAGNFPPSACHPVTAHWLRVYPPDDFTALYISYTSRTCSGNVTRDGDALAVYAVKSGPGVPGGGP